MGAPNSEFPLPVLELPALLSHDHFFVPSSEVFLSDQASNLFALDLRTGGVVYGYQGTQTFWCLAPLSIESNPSFGATFPSFQGFLGQSRPWRVHPIMLGPRRSIGSSGSTGRPPRRRPRIGRDRPLRKCIPRALRPSLFGTRRMKTVGHLFTKMTKVKGIRCGKIWKTQRTVERVTAMTKRRETRTTNHPQIPRTKSPARDDVVTVSLDNEIQLCSRRHINKH